MQTSLLSGYDRDTSAALSTRAANGDWWSADRLLKSVHRRCSDYAWKYSSLTVTIWRLFLCPVCSDSKMPELIFELNYVWNNHILLSKNPEKSITVSTKIRSNTTVFNINDNQKCFLSSKSEIDFWRSCDTEDWRMMLKIQLRITGINYILKY